MRLLVTVIALLGGFVLVGMLVAPSYPPLRDWYAVNACPHMDKLSTDICASIRRTEGKPS